MIEYYVNLHSLLVLIFLTDSNLYLKKTIVRQKCIGNIKIYFSLNYFY